MMTLRQLAAEPPTLPMRTTWYLTDLAEAKGKQELFTRQSPQKLKVLREHALIESAVSSNRIEGVEVDQSRIATLLFGKSALRDRDEEEVRGYRDALKLIHENGAKLSISEATITTLHKLSRGEIWDAGAYKEKNVDIIQTYADGRSRVRFKTLPAKDTPGAMAEMIELWQRGLREKWVHPLVLAAALNLDFLCIHPFRDGNGRTSRLLFLLACYHCGIEAGRYISLERIIEDNKERYYEVLEHSSQRWHEGKHDPWPAMNFLLYILAHACKEFEERVGRMTSPRGAKTEMVEHAIETISGEFGITDLERRCPGVSRDMIRLLLRDLKAAGRIECLGRGPGAKWRKRVIPLKEGSKEGSNRRMK
jgi:Fic family protein